MARVLLVDGDADILQWVKWAMASCGHIFIPAEDVTSAVSWLAHESVDVVIADLSLGNESGFELCELVADQWPGVPVILTSIHNRFDKAVRAIRAGAFDFVAKPLDAAELRLALDRAVSHSELRNQVAQLRQRVSQSSRCGDLMGTSVAIRKVFSLVERVRDLDTTVLVTGESGTGKELIARTLHQCGKRSAGPFVALNCAAVPASLIETELFGHARGAFTDAAGERKGLFQQAHGGTIFLDEIGELPVALQPKILRALQERAVRPVGGDKEVAIDVRIVAATHRDLQHEVKAGRFREDLFYRLNVISIDVPPLRERGEDVLMYAQHFLEMYAGTMQKRIAGISTEAARRLTAYGWPGNIRELQNCMERAVALAQGDWILPVDLPDPIRCARTNRMPQANLDGFECLSLEEVESRHIERVLQAVGGNKSAAAEILGLDRRTLYRKPAVPRAPRDRRPPKGRRPLVGRV